MPKGRQLDYTIATALYAVAVITARGVGFKMTIPWGFWQLLDARTLREHPFGSLCLMHHQPPGLNALLAGILTVADWVGCTPEAIVTVLFLVLGLVAAIVSYRLALALTGSRALAGIAVAFLLTDPAYHVNANLFFYELPLYTLHLLLLAAALDYLVHGRRLLLVGLLACAITLTRTLFHPMWAVAVCGLVVLMRRWSSQVTGAVDRRQVLALSALVAVAISLWPLKNRIVFGRAFYATMSSYSLARGLPGCGSVELNSYLETGLVSSEVAAMAARPLRSCGDAASSVILSTVKVDGSRNWNHLLLLAVAEGFDRCSAAWRFDHPREWLKRAAGQYAMWMRGGYINPYDQAVYGPFERSYYGYTLQYDRVLYANLRPLLERLFPHWTLHQAAMVRGRAVPYSLFGFVLFPMTVAVVLARWLWGPWTPRKAAIAIAMFSVLWAMLGACATDGIEGNRMRFSTTGLFAVILAYAIHALHDLIRAVARRRLHVVAVVLLVALASAAETSASEEVPLSADDRPANVDSTYGSGNFGAWYVDGFGLPAFRYDADEQGDPRAQQPELAGATEAQHQLGNDHIVAAAFNHGYTQLWSQDRLSQWANLYEPASRHWAGGYGYLVVDGTVTSTLWLDRGDATSLERDFGVGYFRKALGTAGVDVEQVVYAPFGDDPLLLDDVTITNRADTAKTVSWFEYWDVNPYDQTAQVNRGVGQPVFDPSALTLSVSQSGGHLDDPAPLTIFAAVLQGPLDGFETSLATFFGDGTRAAPAEVAADHLSSTLAPPSPPGAAGGTLFAFRAPLVLAPGRTVTLRYAYGMAQADQVGGLVAKYRAQADSFGESERAWASWLPKADFGRSRRWVARELAWDAYLLRSASVYEELCGHHTITQGGYYQYLSGLNLGFRSWPHYLLPITYMEPELAREILRYTIGLQPQADNQFAYGTGPMCTLFSLGTSGDLDFWLLLAAAEYGLGSRDRAFFSEPIPFYDTKQPATAWEHIKLAYRHQETLRGPHGGYAAGTNGDWSDFSAPFLQMSESTLVGVQVAYAYPKLADLADRLDDHAFALELRARAAELRRVLRGEWTGRGWYPRGYGGDRQIGSGAIFGEPQPWAVLAGIPTPRQSRRLVSNVRRFLGGVGAPPIVHGPSRIGSSLTPAHDDPDVTERSAEPVGVGDNNANYVGGVWFDVNGWLTWALGELDGIVPHARRFAWSEYTRNTLANHATQFPDHWAGTISIDDTCYSYYSSHPERCGNDLYRQYDGQITEQPTWMVMDAIRLAGITPTEAGYRIAPHFPFVRFSLRLPQIGIARNGRGLRGYLRAQETESIELRVRVPGGIARGALETRANGHAVAHRIAGRFVVFRLRAAAGGAADWAVTWSGAR